MALAIHGSTVEMRRYALEGGRVVIMVDGRWKENPTGTRDDRLLFEIENRAPPWTGALLWIEILHDQSVDTRVSSITNVSDLHIRKQLPAPGDRRDACVLSREEPVTGGRYIAIDRIALRQDLTMHARIGWQTDARPAGLTQHWFVREANQMISGIQIDGTAIGAVARLIEASGPDSDLDLVESAK